MLLARVTRLFLLLTFLLATATTGVAAPPEGKGKGGGNGGGEDPPPEPAPVAYGLLRFSMPDDYQGGSAWIEEINDVGEAVGYYSIGGGYEQPFYISLNDINGVVFENLNDRFPDLTSLDTEPPAADVSGWQIAAATGINNFGDIALALSRVSDPDGLDELRGAVLELRPEPLDPTVGPRLHLIPDAAWSHTYARRINDAGIVLGRGDSTTSYIYQPGLHGMVAGSGVELLPFPIDAWVVQMNNPTADHGTQLVFGGSGVQQYTLGDANPVLLTSEVSLSARGLSDSGAFCGSRSLRGNKQNGAVYDGTVIDFPELHSAEALNADGDVLGDSKKSRELTLLHPTHGALNLKQLTIGMTNEDQQLWDDGNSFYHRISERNVLGTDPSVADFPVISGTLPRFDTELAFRYDVFLLVPLPPE